MLNKLSIAPMLDWTDRHYRYFMRQITRNATLYTEMIVADAIIHGNYQKLLEYSSVEQPLVLQLGGSDRMKLAAASRIAQDFAYTAINLNVGCPSDRVKAGKFGACLMAEPCLVADCVKAMQDAVDIPITVKHRIGLDKNEEYGFVRDFVGIVAEAGCQHFIVHARNAILNGLSPRENREIPPLKYDYVYRLKQEFPHLVFTLNGGIKTAEEVETHLQYVDAVMIGREAYYNPYLFMQLEYVLDNDYPIISRDEVAIKMLEYLIQLATAGIPLHHVTRHMIGLYHGCPHAKAWRVALTTAMIKENNISVYERLLNKMENNL